MPSSACKKSDVCSRSEEHTSELQSRQYLVCRLLLAKTRSYGPFTQHFRHDRSFTRNAGGRKHHAVERDVRKDPGSSTRALDASRVGAFFFLSDRHPPGLYPFPPRGALRI